MALEPVVDEVRADEAGAAGDEEAHRAERLAAAIRREASRRPSRQCGSAGAPAARSAGRSTPGAAPGARAPRSRCGARGSSSPPPRRSPPRSRPRCSRRPRRGARRRAEGRRRRARGRPRPDARRTSGSRAGRRRRRPRRARRRGGASSARSCGRSARRARTCGRSRRPRPAAASPWSFVRPYAESGFDAVGLHVRLALPAVEHVVGGERDQRRAERRRVCGPGDVHRSRALRIRLGAVDVGPGRRVQNEIEPALCQVVVGGQRTSHSRTGRARRRRRPRTPAASARPSWPPAPVIRTRRRRPARTRIGVLELHRCATRGSFQGTVCSSGSAGSYSSVTW